MRCKFCGQNITFNDLIKSRSGRKIPLNLDNSIHKCVKNDDVRNNNRSSSGSSQFTVLLFSNRNVR